MLPRLIELYQGPWSDTCVLCGFKIKEPVMSARAWRGARLGVKHSAMSRHAKARHAGLWRWAVTNPGASFPGLRSSAVLEQGVTPRYQVDRRTGLATPLAPSP